MMPTATKPAPIPRTRAKTAYGLLSEVCRLILDEPKRYNQERFIARKDGAHGADKFPPLGFPSCGTVGCVAGWVATLVRGENFNYNATEDIAMEALGIDYGLAYNLFSGGAVKRQDQQTEAYARAGVAHIKRFQKKYAAQLKAKRL